MPSTERRSRRIDVQLPNTGGGTILSGASAPGAASNIPAPGVPTGLRVLTTALLFSAVTARAGAELAWLVPAGIAPDAYTVQWSTTAGFTSAETLTADRGQFSSFAVAGLPVNTLVYFRVAALARGVLGAWSASASTTTPVDVSPPDPPTSPAATFLSSGALRISWAKSASPNFKSVEVRIFNSASKTVEYDLISEADGSVYDWPAARNRSQSVGSPDGSPDRSVYVELRARSWGNVFSTTVNASATLAVPANVVGATATWDGATGSCRFSWTPVSGAVAYRLTIDGTPRTVADTQHLYDLATNRVEHSGTPDPDLSWSIVAIDALDQVSASAASGTATLARPATPTSVAHAWSGDTGTAGADWSIDCAPISGVTKRQLTLDSVVRDLPVVGRYAYPFDLNAQEHSGVGDPVLSYSLVWVDALGQTSTTPASGTATNAAPAAPSAVALIALFAGFRVDVTCVAPADFKTYRYRIIQTSPAAGDVTMEDPAASIPRNVTTPATYQVGVRAVDRFDQASTETLSTALLVDALSLALLRERLVYSDSDSTAAAPLKRDMSDGVLGSGGVSYASNAGWVRSITADWQLLERIKVITLAMAPASGTTSWYLRTSKDNATWSYFSGPLVATGATGQSTTLTSVASAAAAQTAAVSSATLGNSTFARVDLPSVQECRYVELWLRNTAAATTLNEFFPRRLIQTDDLEAESIRAFNIAAGAVTADKLTIPGTASFDAQLRLIQFRVPVGLDLGSGIYQGTGTFASPTTGLKLWNDGGIGRLATYNAGVAQVQLDTNGELVAGGGTFRANGTRVVFQRTLGLANNESLLRVQALDATPMFYLRATEMTGGGVSEHKIQLQIDAHPSSGKFTFVIPGYEYTNFTGVFKLSLFGAEVGITGGLSVGTATAVASGEVRASGSSGGNYMVIIGNEVPSGQRGLSLRYRSDLDRVQISSVHQGTSFKPMQLLASQMGFFDAVPIFKPTVAAVATDLASVIALANSLRSAMGSLGLAQ